jgi:N-acetylneuraminic acid mutarotase
MKHTILCFALFVFICSFIPTDSYAQGRWATASSTGFTARAGLASCEVGGKIYVFGGLAGGIKGTTYLNTFEIFDPQKNTWSTPITKGKNSPRFGLTACVVNNLIYVIGGYDGKKSLSTVEVLDAGTNIWSTLSTTGNVTARNGHCAAVVGGKIYVFGGNDLLNIPGVEMLDPGSNIWTKVTTSGTFTPRFGLTCSVVGGKIYVMGGNDGTHFLNIVEVFDPVFNSWSTPTTTGTFTPREALCSSFVGGMIYVIGGDTSFIVNNYPNTVEAFDPATNVWTTPQTTGTFTGRAGLTCSETGGKIYVLGGVNGPSLNTNEVFTPPPSLVNPDSRNTDINLFPNPTTGPLTIELPTSSEMNVTVMNLLGATVMELKNLHTPDFTLDLSKLVPATYYIRFSSVNSVVTKMVVKM